jgi:hypothetical protein
MTYSPQVAARLARALLQEAPSAVKTNGDVMMTAVDEMGEVDAVDDTPVEQLSLKGYVLLLLDHDKRCVSTSSSQRPQI